MEKNEEIINRLSLKYNVPKHIVKDIVESQFEFTRATIKELDFNGVTEEDLDDMKTSFRFLNIGSLAVSGKALRDINKNRKK